MAERLGSALAGRSAASSGGRTSAGSIKARFGQVLPRIGFPSRPSTEIKALNSLPLRNDIPNKGTDSGKSKPTVVFFNIGNAVPDRGGDVAQPNVVTESIWFPVPKPAESKSNILQPPEARAAKAAPAVEQSKGKIILLNVEPARIQPALVPEVSQPVPVKPGLEIKTPVTSNTEAVRARSLLEQQIILNRVVRSASLIRAIRMQQRAAVNPESKAVTQSQVLAQPGLESSVSTPSQVLAEPVLQTEPQKTAPNRIKTGLLGSVNRMISLQERRKKYLAREEDINERRQQDLIKANLELQTSDPENASGEKVVAKANLISEENGSTLLVQLGDRKRRKDDGGLYRLAQFLGSIRRLDSDKIIKGVQEYTAVKLTDEQPYNPATNDEGETVLRPPQSPFSEGLPESVLTEVTEKTIKSEAKSANLAGEVVQAPVVNESRVSAEEIAALEPEIQSSHNYVESLLDSVMYISKVFQPIGADEINRRQLILAE